MTRNVKVIPCLDSRDGQVVKGVNFEGVKAVGEIEDLVQQYEADGADELVILDITATEEKRKTMVELVERYMRVSSVPLTIGGGLASVEDVQRMFDAGVQRVSLATAAVKDPDLVEDLIARFGAGKIVVAVDSQWDDATGEYRVLVQGGKVDAGVTLIEYCQRLVGNGVKTVLVTSKDKDGTKSGFDQKMYHAISHVVDLEIIASGGAVSIEDSVETAKNNPNIVGILAASIFHYGEIGVGELKEALVQEGLARND